MNNLKSDEFRKRHGDVSTPFQRFPCKPRENIEESASRAIINRSFAIMSTKSRTDAILVDFQNKNSQRTEDERVFAFS